MNVDSITNRTKDVVSSMDSNEQECIILICCTIALKILILATCLHILSNYHKNTQNEMNPKSNIEKRVERSNTENDESTPLLTEISAEQECTQSLSLRKKKGPSTRLVSSLCQNMNDCRGL